MAVKLYDQDAYLNEFEATVTGCFITADGTFELTLDKTAFFPNEGGQSCDKGTINGMEVLNVEYKENEIFHIVKFFIPEGTTVEGKIDFAHRFSNMQMHTGEHIFSGLVHKEFGFNNVGFHLSDNSATMDYDGKLSEDDVKGLEILANRMIWAAKNVRAFFPSEEDLLELDYRSKSGIKGDIRIVEIEDVDLCACCAPHVKNTSEVGIFKITSVETYKGGTRLNYLAGERAYNDYLRLSELESELSRSLNAKKGNISESVGKLKHSISELEYSNIALKRMKVSAVCDSATTPFIFLDSDYADIMRFALGELKSKFNGLCAVFAGNDESGYRYLIEYDGKDLVDLAEKLKATFEIKGGGRSGSLQGNLIGSKDSINAFLETQIGA